MRRRLSHLTLDSNIFKNQSFDFEASPLKDIIQFKGDARFVISEIVKKELFSLFCEEARNKVSSLISSAEKPIVRGFLSGKVLQDLKSHKGKVNYEDIARDRIGTYFRETGAAIIPYSDTKIDDVMDAYFDHRPPFSGKKKAEFPDAVALISLENWALSLGAMIAVVSDDNDWKEYCDRSDVLKHFKSTPEAIVAIRGQSAELVEQVRNTLLTLQKEGLPQWTSINKNIAERAESSLFPMFESDFYVLCDKFKVDIKNLKLSDDSSRGELTVLNDDSDGTSLILYLKFDMFGDIIFDKPNLVDYI